MKRKFSSLKLYKFLKITAIIISILAAIIWLLNYSALIADRSFDLCNDYSNNIELYRLCLDNAFKKIHTYRNTSYISGAIAVLLPTLFFGGKKLYDYLYPETKK